MRPYLKRGICLLASIAVLLGTTTYLFISANNPADLSEVKVYQDFENYTNTFESGFTSVQMPTTNPSEVINGGASGVVSGTGDINTYTHGMWQIGYRLEANKDYTLSFKYKAAQLQPGSRFYMIAKSDIAGDGDNHYIFFNNTVNEYECEDMSDWYKFNIIDKGEYLHLRFSFTNNHNTDRYLIWGVQGTGTMIIDDVILAVGNSGISNDVLSPIAQNESNPQVTQNFESTLSDLSNMVLSPNQTYFVGDSINGTTSLRGVSGSNWTFAETKATSVPLASYGIHTVTFKMKKEGNLQPGEFYHFTAMTPTGRSANGFANDRYFRWDNDGNIFEAGTGSLAHLAQLRSYVQNKGDYWFVKLTFYIDNYSDYVLQWGINSSTQKAMIIDDIRVFYGKDFSFDIPVVKQTVNPVHALDFEDGTHTGVSLSNGGFETVLPALINGSSSYKAKTEPNSDWQQILGSNPSQITFQSNSYYTFSWRMKVLEQSDGFVQLAMISDSHSSDSVIRIATNLTDAGSFNMPFGYSHADEGNGIIRFTATFKTGSQPNHRFEIYFYNGGEISFDDLTIYEGCVAGTPSAIQPEEQSMIPVFVERFENQDTALWGMNPIGGFVAHTGDHVINGKYSFAARHVGGEYYTSLESRSSSLTMSPNTTYTVTFRYKVLPASGLNGNFMFAAKTEEGSYLKDKFVRFTPSGNEVLGVGNNVTSFSTVSRGSYVDAIVTFTTENYTDYRLIFVSVGEGDWSIDDIRVFKGSLIVEDTAPSVELVTVAPVYTESFNSADLSNSPFVYNTGRITYTQNTIINGSYSYRLTPAPDAYGYTIPLVSHAGRTNFQAGKTYTVRMRYKAISNLNNGFVMLAFRSNIGDQYTKFMVDGTKVEGNDRAFFVENKGEYYELTATFTLGSASYYEFASVFQNSPEIIVDDIEIYEGFLYNSLPSISVNVPVITPIFTDGFEQTTLTSGLLVRPYSGKYTFENGTVIDGKHSYAAKGIPGDNWTKVLDTAPLSLAPNKTFTLTFQYTDAQILAEGGFYQVALKTNAGGPVNDQYIRFLADGTIFAGNAIHTNVVKDGDVYTVAATFALKNFYDYCIEFVIYDNCYLTLDNFNLYSGGLYAENRSRLVEATVPSIVKTESFEQDTNKLFSLKAGKYIIEQPKLINGAASLAIFANPDVYGYTIAATSKTNELTLNANNIYTVRMKYRITEALASGGYFMLAMRTEAGGSLNDRYVRFNANNHYESGNTIAHSTSVAGDVVIMTASFALANFSDYNLSLLSYGNSGELTVDDLTVYSGVVTDNDSSISPTPKTPEQIKSKTVTTENFEHNGYIGNHFFIRQGQLVYDAQSIVNGSFSLAMKGLGSGLWMDGFVSNLDNLVFEPNTTYSLVFRHRQWIPSSDGGFIQIAAREVGGNYLNDSFVRFTSNGLFVDGVGSYALAHQSDAYNTSVFTFTTTNLPTELALSAFGTGGIIVDDLVIYKGVAYTYSTEPVSITVPAGTINSGDYTAPVISGNIYDGDYSNIEKGNSAARSDDIEFESKEPAKDPYVLVEKTVETEVPYEETIEHKAVIKKTIRRKKPKTNNIVPIAAGSGAGALLIAGAVVFFIFRKKKNLLVVENDISPSEK